MPWLVGCGRVALSPLWICEDYRFQCGEVVWRLVGIKDEGYQR